MPSFQCDLVTPQGSAFAEPCDVVTLPGVEGSFQILFNHAPLVAVLAAGPVRIAQGSRTRDFQITGGVVEVLANTVTILAERVTEGGK
jgi:F-type H+-transporting ATPase subunit epsilon